MFAFLAKLDDIKFIMTLMSIRVLVQVSFTHIHIKRDIAEYSVTARVCFWYLLVNIQMLLHLFEDLLWDVFVNLLEEFSSFLLLISQTQDNQTWWDSHNSWDSFWGPVACTLAWLLILSFTWLVKCSCFLWLHTPYSW